MRANKGGNCNEKNRSPLRSRLGRHPGGLDASDASVHERRTVDFDHSEILGYSSMVLSFLLVFFGIRSYRDNVAGGAISFGKAFQVGILITLITCAMYVIAWEITYFNFFPDFLDNTARTSSPRCARRARARPPSGRRPRRWPTLAKHYDNPLFNVRHHLHGGVPGRAHHDAGLRRDPAPEAPPGCARVGRAGLTLLLSGSIPAGLFLLNGSRATLAPDPHH